MSVPLSVQNRTRWRSPVAAKISLPLAPLNRWVSDPDPPWTSVVAVTWVPHARCRTGVEMWHRLEALPVPTTDFRIERVGPGGDASARIGPVDAYGFPDVVAGASSGVGRRGRAHHIAFDGDLPVSAAAMRIEDGVAWLGSGATLEAHRGRGGQSAMFALRLRDARDAGCRFALTENRRGDRTNRTPSYRNMVRSASRSPIDTTGCD